MTARGWAEMLPPTPEQERLGCRAGQPFTGPSRARSGLSPPLHTVQGDVKVCRRSPAGRPHLPRATRALRPRRTGRPDLLRTVGERARPNHRRRGSAGGPDLPRATARISASSDRKARPPSRRLRARHVPTTGAGIRPEGRASCGPPASCGLARAGRSDPRGPSASSHASATRAEIRPEGRTSGGPPSPCGLVGPAGSPGCANDPS